MRKPRRRYLSKYRDFLTTDGSDGADFRFERPSDFLLMKYRAEIINPEIFGKQRRKSDIRLLYVSEEGSAGAYIVDLGALRFTINVLNLQGNSPSGNEVGEGSYGKVMIKMVGNTEFVAKVIKRETRTTK